MTGSREQLVWGFRQLACLISLLSLVGIAGANPAERDRSETADKGIVLLLLPTLTLQEAASLPEISSLMQTGYSALASSRIGRWQSAVFAPLVPDPITSAYYTMASGSPSAAGREGALILEAGEPGSWGSARDVWETFSGRVPTGQGYAPFIGQLIRIAAAAPYPTQPGSLGDILEDNGIPSCVIGNADHNDVYSREAGLFVMTSTGRISGARLNGGFTIPDQDFPFGQRTDTVALHTEILERFQDTRFIVVETGDLLRFARAEATFTSAGRLEMRKRVLASADTLVGDVAASLPEGWRLVIVAPAGPRSSDSAADRLVPIISFKDGTGSGLLVSSSTRRLGVLVNTDLASSLATWLLGGETVSGAGRPARLQPHKSPTTHLETLWAQADYQGKNRPVVYLVVYCMAALLAASSLLLAGRKKRTPALVMASAAAAMPMGLLISTPFMPSAGLLTGTAILTALLAGLVSYKARGSLWLAALASLCIPTALAAGWMHWAVASYEVQGGARFYGMGNEYGGYFVGASFFVASSLLLMNRMKHRGLAAGAVVVLAILFTGHPSLGANAGITTAGILAGLVLAFGNMGIRNAGVLAGAVAGVVILLISAATLDSLRPEEEQSHFGRVIHRITETGPNAGLELVQRKAAVNWMLVQNSPWSVLLVSGAVSGLLVGYVSGRKGNTVHRRKSPARLHAVRTWTLWVVFGALLLLNDSGVLAAAAAGPWLCLACLHSWEV